MKITEKIVANGYGALNPSYICIHETANPGATAANHVSYWKNNPTFAVHYVADWTGAVYHTVPDNRLCNQVGNGNPYVLGIELCHAKTKENFQKVWDLGVEWAAYMLKKKGWGIDRLISHDDARRKWGGTDHTDPIGYFKKYGKTWAQFVAAVKAKLGGTATTPSTSSGSTNTTATYTVKKGDTLYKIAKANGTTVAELTKINNLGDPAKIKVGQVLKLKAAATKPATSTTSKNPYTEPTGQYVQLGTIGNGAKWVQWELKRLGYDIGASGIDGIIGSKSAAAIRAFQKAKKLSVDGIVGPATRAALKKA